MHIIVCVKQVPNPEAAFSMFKVDEQGKKVIPASGLQMVMSPFDEQALEAALRIRDAGSDTRITVMTLGAESVRSVLKHGLAMGADDGVLLGDAAFQDGDACSTARVLSAAIGKLGDCDLVLTGRQAADWDAGIVGCGIAELLHLPVITFARDLKVSDGVARVERVVENGFDVVEAPLPAVVTVSNELGAARAPSLRETMRAARKPIAIWSAADLGLELNEVGAAGARRVLDRLFIPPKKGACELVDGATPEEQGSNLAQRLLQAKLL
ncbi:MAG: electron transfer flavoprotein subunit beta/FixA family protein [Betaproteobacteria bacterium]|nr:electron transfer flavoprotein subunit beta/FixA family protein [Betaproteobacteria bacterium]MDH3435441.1 electron transfer flavoprotein subunit beta/FixA family protein [Betaproteobacteria bacterium]